MGKKATANSGSTEEGGPSALAARTSVSVNRGHDNSPATRAQSLPPLPPGPVQSAPSPLSLSLNNSVLGLGGLGKAKLVLEPLVSSGPMVKSPSSHSHSNSMQNLASLMGGNGGENAYANSKPPLPYVYIPPSTIVR